MASFVSCFQTWAPVAASRLERKGRKFRPLRPISPEDSHIFSCILRGEFQIQGVRNSDLRKHLYPETELDRTRRRKHSARITRYLGLLQSHELIYRVPKTNYYRVTKKGNEVMSTALKFRITDFALLAA